jgi:hypothetical protein
MLKDGNGRPCHHVRLQGLSAKVNTVCTVTQAAAERAPLLPPRWAGTEGQDFLTNSQDPNIDFAVMHLWVDNWLVRRLQAAIALPHADTACLNDHLRSVVCISYKGHICYLMLYMSAGRHPTVPHNLDQCAHCGCRSHEQAGRLIRECVIGQCLHMHMDCDHDQQNRRPWH